MNAATILIFVLAVPGQQPAATGADRTRPRKPRASSLLELHTTDAASYSIYRDERAHAEARAAGASRSIAGPIPRESGGKSARSSSGRTAAGRRSSAASSRTRPTIDRRVVCHELHSLSLAVLVVDREAAEHWVPQAAGVELKPVEGAPRRPARPAQRLAQMRSLAREFSGRSLSDQGQAWELRLLAAAALPLREHRSRRPRRRPLRPGLVGRHRPRDHPRARGPQDADPAASGSTAPRGSRT